jgi:hypothetical protein
MSIIPRVVINGGMRPRVVIRPLTSPHPSPTRSPPATATRPEWPATRRSATTRPLKARIEPTDRSIPPEMITKVRPMPRMALIADCCMTLRRLSVVRKWGEAIPKRMTRRIRN